MVEDTLNWTKTMLHLGGEKWTEKKKSPGTEPFKAMRASSHMNLAVHTPN